MMPDTLTPQQFYDFIDQYIHKIDRHGERKYKLTKDDCNDIGQLLFELQSFVERIFHDAIDEGKRSYLKVVK